MYNLHKTELKELFKKLIRQHASLLVMMIGSGSIFLSNILFKDILSSESYGIYSIFVTYISIINSFGLLGFEQVFLRVTDNSQKDLLIADKSLMTIMITAWLLFGVICAVVFNHYFLKDILSFWILCSCTLGIGLSMFLSNAFRVNSNFVTAQLYSNYWKVMLLFISMVFLLFGFNSINLTLNVLSLIFAFVSILGVIILIRNIKFQFQKKENIKRILLFALQFFISLLTLSVIGQGDKFFVEKAFGLKKLGEYFFLANIFIFPFSMLQSYVGFKELVRFKKSFSKSFFFGKIRNVNILGVFLGLALLLISWICEQFGLLTIEFNHNLLLIIVFLLIGISKLNYALMSSVFGAIGEVRSIFRANFQFIFAFVIFLFLFYGRMNSLLYVSMAILIMWIFRIVIWNFNILSQINED